MHSAESNKQIYPATNKESIYSIHIIQQHKLNTNKPIKNRQDYIWSHSSNASSNSWMPSKY